MSFYRLDKETSGAIVLAKNPFVLPILGRLLETKQISISSDCSWSLNQKAESISRLVVIGMIAETTD